MIPVFTHAKLHSGIIKLSFVNEMEVFPKLPVHIKNC